MAGEDDGDVGLADDRLDDGIPVCLGCFTPVEPLASYCARCGRVVGQHTQYVPYTNIAWQAAGYDRLRRAAWPAKGLVAKLAGVFAAVGLAPFLLLWLPLKGRVARRKAASRRAEDATAARQRDRAEDP